MENKLKSEDMVDYPDSGRWVRDASLVMYR